ncbi:MAG TPA: tetratricopeptide repeat protein [Mycobacteriales bacterium]|nr:tetratricopeptide repeat protein [Mycobacteriales bacterium]
MNFRVLGPVEVRVQGRQVEPGPPQQQVLLAALLADASRVVTTETLIDRIWDEPPDSARRNVHGLVARLRRVLAQASPDRTVVLLRRAGGYVLDVRPEQVDALEFRRLVEQARGRGCADAVGRELLGQALSLWRGEPLSGLSGSWVARTRQAWSQLHLEAVVAWARAELGAGDPAGVIVRVTDLLARYPLAESLYEILLRALHAAGRPAEALDLYASFRQRLAEELGADPGAELQAAHQQILRGESSRLPLVAAAMPPVPEQLPATARYFVGRAEELDRLDQAARHSTGAVIAAVDGMPGIGKTALVVLAGRRMAETGLFPDGQLFVDLRGFSDGPPTDPAAALETLLRGLGVPGPRIPPGLDARSGLYRSVLAHRRVLVVLDNAQEEAQVRPLLPGAGESRVLVTSRRRLSGFDDIEHLNLDSLPAPDAASLFRAVAGADRDPGEAQTVEQIVRQCGRLPLAVRIAAARLRTDRGRTPMTGRDLLDLLRTQDQDHRLAILTGGDRSIGLAFEVSYQHLPADQQRAFAVLGLHPGPEYEPYATAALLDTTTGRAHELLNALEQVNLLDQPAPGRYRFHDLIRAYARTRAPRGAERRAALGQLLDHYAHTATAVMDVAYPYEIDHRPRPPKSSTPSPCLLTEAAALGWLETELENLLAAAQHTVDENPGNHTIHLSATLRRHLRTRGHYGEAETLHQLAITAARATGDHDAEIEAFNGLGQIHRLRGRQGAAIECHDRALAGAHTTRQQVDALIGLGSVYYLQGQHDAAAACFRHALASATGSGDVPAEIEALNGLGYIHNLQGEQDLAVSHHESALAAARASGNRAGETSALNGLGNSRQMQGQHAVAGESFSQALAAARATGSRIAELVALNGLGRVHTAQGQYELAAGRYHEALAAARAAGDRHGEIAGLIGLGEIHLELGRHADGASCYRQVLELARLHGNRNWQIEGYLGLGRVHQADNDPAQALAAHQHALTLAAELDQAPDEARAHDGLARAHHAIGHIDQARQHWHQALDILDMLHTPVAEETTAADLRAHLADLDNATGAGRA